VRRIVLCLMASTLVFSAAPAQAQTPTPRAAIPLKQLVGGNPAAVVLQHRAEFGLSTDQVRQLREIEERLDAENAALEAPSPDSEVVRGSGPQPEGISGAARQELEQGLHGMRAVRVMHVNVRRAGAEVVE
jgi:hypothetical protein